MNPLPVGPHRVEDMVKFCLETSRRMMAKNGVFAPFGSVIDFSGDRKLTVADATPERPLSAEAAYSALEHGMRAQFLKGEIIAGAIVALAGVPAELKPAFPDAIRVVVESNTISRLIFLPYRVSPRASVSTEGSEPHVFEFGELIGVDVRRTIFADA